jgi:lysine 2,3-aminomutase
MTGLLKIRVRPYYLYHCDNVTGVSHFLTSIEKGREIMDNLIGYTTGFALPQYILTTKIGKIPLTRDYLSLSEDGKMRLRNYAGKTIEYSEAEILEIDS